MVEGRPRVVFGAFDISCNRGDGESLSTYREAARAARRHLAHALPSEEAVSIVQTVWRKPRG